MTGTREYIVSTIRGVDISEIDAEMTSSSGSDTIPHRSCEICNARPVNTRQTHYHLTEEEVIALRNDPRIAAVEIPPEHRDDIEISHSAIQYSDFTKTTSDSGNFVNWGLKRCIAETNIYSVFDTTDSVFSYSADGSGVDVVIQDSGLQVDHPEFIDDNGNSRVQLIDWHAASGVPGTQDVDHYRDFDGHGTHCAGIAAGKTYGWAKNSRVYSVKVNSLAGVGDEGTGFTLTDCFDVIIGWHQNKPIDPNTGYKRPTVVSISWGYIGSFTDITGGVYRGVAWTGTVKDNTKGMLGAQSGGVFRHGIRVASTDINVQEMIDAGIHVSIAAGNTFQTVDIPGGIDYDNYYTKTLVGNVFYHRGKSPFDDQAMNVGNVDTAVGGVNLEWKNQSSETGPGIDIYAPGTNILSCTSNTNRWGVGSQNYFLNSNFKQTNISGSSMAAPQVAGVMACYLQVNPQMTPTQLKSKILSDSKTNRLFDTGLNDDYTNNRSLKGGNNIFLYNKYNQAVTSTASGALNTSILPNSNG